MTEELVMCSKIGCRSEAAAVLLIAPGDTQAWLLALDHPDASEGVLLCEMHAERVSVPKGWTLDDERALARSTKRRRKKSKRKKAEQQVAAEADIKAETAEAETHEVDAPEVESPESSDDLAAADATAAESEAAAPDDGADEPTLVNEAIVVPDAAEELTETDPTREITLAVPGDPGAAADEAVGRHLRKPDAPTGRDAVVANTSEPSGDEEIDLVAEDERPLSVVPVQEDELPFEEANPSVTETGSHLIATDSTPLLKRAFRVVEDG